MIHRKHIHSPQETLKRNASPAFKVLPVTFMVCFIFAAYTSSGRAVSIGDIKATDTKGEPIETTTIEIPDKDAPEDESIDVVKGGHLINPKSEYVIDAEGHKAVTVTGEDLIQSGSVQLKPTPKRHMVILHEERPEDRATELAKAIYLLTGEDEKDWARIGNLLIEHRKSSGLDATETEEETEEDIKIESVVPYLQPIVIINGGSGPVELEKSKEIELVLEWMIVDWWREKQKLGTSSEDKAGAATETTADMFVFEWLSPFDDDDLGIEPDDSGMVFRYKFFKEPKPLEPFIIEDDPRKIQQSETFPNDPLFKSRGSWGQSYFDQWGLHRIGFRPIHEDQEKSLWPNKAKPVIVAVIDTGIDRTHPEISESLWKNGKEIPGNGEDDDKNGYVDDVHGWNFVDNNNDIGDINGHGTITAGIIAALINNKIGIAGVNPWAKIMPIKAMEWNGRGWAFDIAKAIIYAVNNGARVVNISIGGKRLNRMELLAVGYARSKGVVVVAAAGNEGMNTNEYSPAGLPGVVTVAATGPDDKRVGYSGWGAGIDIAAPGVDILSLRAKRTDLLKFEKKDYKPGTAFVGRGKDYYRVTGTSFSAPFVSGVASLILSKSPELSGMQATRMILHSARDIDVPGWDQFTGYGLLDAEAAFRADPDFYVISRIFKVAGTKKEGKFHIEVSGRAMADHFKRAWIAAGKGNHPTKWNKVSDDITAPVKGGQLALIAPQHFKGAKTWTLRLIVEHENGFKRESRFNLKLG